MMRIWQAGVRLLCCSLLTTTADRTNYRSFFATALGKIDIRGWKLSWPPHGRIIRHNKVEIGILPLMVRLLIDTYRTGEHQPGRLGGELTSQEIKKCVTMCLKPGQSTGQDRCSSELTKPMTDEKCQIVKMWVNEILTEDTS